jgi:hypothetical protein
VGEYMDVMTLRCVAICWFAAWYLVAWGPIVDSGALISRVDVVVVARLGNGVSNPGCTIQCLACHVPRCMYVSCVLVSFHRFAGPAAQR